MIYLSGKVVTHRHPRLGFLITPRQRVPIPSGAPVAADNGCFADPDSYSDSKYLSFLKQFPRDRTLFAPAPDVLGDHNATVRRSLPMLCKIRQLGLPAAFVAQDGWREDTTPWDEFDVLFVGGSTAFKFRGGRDAVIAALARGKQAHMGRVNSMRRLRAAAAVGCHSSDGTFLKFAPTGNIGRMLNWFDRIECEPSMAL